MEPTDAGLYYKPPNLTATYSEWAAHRLVANPHTSISYWDARTDYLIWCSDRRTKPEPRTKQRATLKNAGATIKGTGPDLRYHGIALAGPPHDSGYRAGGHPTHPNHTVLAALRALQHAELTTNPHTLNTAYTHLTQGPP